MKVRIDVEEKLKKNNARWVIQKYADKGASTNVRMVVHQEVVFCQGYLLFGECEFERGRGVICKYGVKTFDNDVLASLDSCIVI